MSWVIKLENNLHFGEVLSAADIDKVFYGAVAHHFATRQSYSFLRLVSCVSWRSSGGGKSAVDQSIFLIDLQLQGEMHIAGDIL